MRKLALTSFIMINILCTSSRALTFSVEHQDAIVRIGILFFPRSQTPRVPLYSEGTGFFINETGALLTDAHVVESAEVITVRVAGVDRLLVATVQEIVPSHDLALLQLTHESYTYLKEKKGAIPYLVFDNSDNEISGNRSIAAGYPGYAPTLRIIEGTITKNPKDLSDYTHIECSFETSTDEFGRGSSGGPICNTQGQVISIIQACGPIAHEKDRFFLSGISSNKMAQLIPTLSESFHDTTQCV